ncbi:metal ABC transporter solute-binding protein, Zn/Mn family [Candidatus Thioglobus autotrophicus]|uniref:metal ABC transporter solute-binding protein, Zn/Mn family n=1 Tax=Candidatus Thioglobus autotrophicus TaxID=1705394 RepID=UPI00299CD89F|nr:zinc ABC transporter substrate-binding protein [Candidatus Thioglobus autotrophicus]WPE18333.1 zinc ABC transporter substrate-binding protein [Candidatus Thioglobus autotrophicus]
MKFHLPFITLLFATNVLASPNIVVSIKPIHSIVSALTQGVSIPTLLLSGNQSAHHAHLKPSQISLLEKADLVVIVHPDFEEGLAKSIRNIQADKVLTVDQSEDEQGHEHEHEHEHTGSVNHHSWLNIEDMQDFTQALSQRLIKIDPKNKAIYLDNLDALKLKLDELQDTTQQQLSNYTNQPLMTYNNAFEHFIENYKLKSVGSVSRQHGENLSIFKILKAKQIIKDEKVTCLLFTSEASDKRINTLTEGLKIKTADIDIIGFDIKPGANHYLKLIQDITHKAVQCLK